MFNPSRDEVREMFFGAWRKYRAGAPLAGIESLALEVILQHPEYHAVLEAPARHRDRDYTDETNPFLHMGLHLAIREQVATRRPAGIEQVHQRLAAKFGDAHEAEHRMIEVLAQTLWESQRAGQAPDETVYLERLRRL